MFTFSSKLPQLPDLATKIPHLAPFDACVEAADALAASSGHESKVMMPTKTDPDSGLSDCSVLVSPDGDLLLVPQHGSVWSPKSKTSKSTTTTTSNSNNNSNNNSKPSLFMELMLNGKDDYDSAIFLGNDLQGDKALNGFSAKGWSLPATNTALQQTCATLQHMSQWGEELVYAKKEAAARTIVAVEAMRQHIPVRGGQQRLQPPSRQVHHHSHGKDWEVIDPRATTEFEITPHRTGPLLMPHGTLTKALMALLKYHANCAELESQRWRQASLQRSQPVPVLRQATVECAERTRNRHLALEETVKRTRLMEERLQRLQSMASKRWDDVYTAEDVVSKRVETMMQERSREREMQRMEQLRVAEHCEDGNPLGTTSEEIWSIVSAVAESMDEGSFEPMDLPAVSSNKSTEETSASGGLESSSTPAVTSAELEKTRLSPSSSLTSREQIELDVALPQLRAAAMAADDDVADAADGFMNLLTTLDTTRRSARLAAETCLVSACNAQASCIKSLIKLERQSLEERLRQISALEEICESIDVRADLDAYISADKKERGGTSNMGDDDDGGIASALAILSRHVGGSMGSDPLHRMSVEKAEAHLDDDSITAEMIDEALEKIFSKDNAAKQEDSNDSTETIELRNDFTRSVDFLCKCVSQVGPAARARRSALCYALNSMRSARAEIPTKPQFDGLCRLFSAILTGCNAEEGGVSNAKMCIMLAQTFYMTSDKALELPDECEKREDSARDHRIYVKNSLKDHPIWEQDDFW